MSKKNKRLTLDDRKKIEDLLHKNIKHTQICKTIGINITTFYRDLKKCKDFYNAEEAHKNTGKSKNLIDFDIINKRFGLLTVLEFCNIYKKRSWWKCICDCGKQCIISRKILTEYCSPDRLLSCGCIPKESAGKKSVPIEESMHRKYLDLLCFREIQGRCWNWKGYCQNGKSPKTSWKNKGMTVRKCMYMLTNGLTELNERVYTKCGNLYCFNPDHLTLNVPEKRQYYENS